MAKRKKKNQITLISLLVALVLLSGFYIWYLNRDKFGHKVLEENGGSAMDNSLIIATMDPDLINKIHFKNDHADMTLILEDDSWVSIDDKLRPIKQNYVKNMINLVDEVKVDRVVNEEAEDLAQYGLNLPIAYIEVSQLDGKSLAISLGHMVTGGQGYYGLIEGDEAVYILPTIYGSNLSYSDIDMTHVEHGPSITYDDIYHIEIVQRDGEDFELIYDPDSLYHTTGTPLIPWVVLKPYEQVYSADSTKVSELLSNYSGFSFLNCLEYQTENFAKYGLEDPSASIFIEYYEQYLEEVSEPKLDSDTGEGISQGTVTEEKSFKLYIGDQDDVGNYYVRKHGDNAIYTMSATNVDDMLAIDAFSILSTFISLHNIETVDKIDIEIEGRSYTMEIKREIVVNDEGEEETIASYYYNGQLTDEDVFKYVYQLMIGAKIDTKLREEPSVSGLKPILTISYHISGSDQPHTTKYYPYDDSFYLIDSGYSIRFAADRRSIDKIINAIEEFKLIEN